MTKFAPFFLFLLMMMPNISNSQQFDLQGHRGTRGLMPENSIPGFIKAMEFGVTTLEMDVVITSDGKVIVSHDPWINHEFCLDPDGNQLNETARDKLNIYKMTYDQVKSYDCGSLGNSRFPDQEKQYVVKPLLSDVIMEVENRIKSDSGYPVKYNIEIKSNPETDGEYHPAPAEFSRLVYETIDEMLSWDRVIIQSFDKRVLRYIKDQYHDVQLAYLIQNLNSVSKNLEDLGFTPDIYSPYFMLIKTEDVEYLHGKGVKLIPWTVNEKSDMIKLRDQGVDGLITDYPDRAAELGMGSSKN